MIASDELHNHAFNLFEVPEDLTVTDWAEKNAIHSERTTEMAGR